MNGLTIDPGVRNNNRPLRKFELGYLGLDVWVRQQRLLDRNDLFPVSVGVRKRPEFSIGLDLARRDIHDRLMKVVLEALSIWLLPRVKRRQQPQRELTVPLK